MLTATQMFSGVTAIPDCWTERCFFCGGRCDKAISSHSFVKKSFTRLDTVTQSPWICVGCIAVMSEDARIVLPDGVVRDKQKVRGYSWVIYPDGCKVAATKSHKAWLLEQCLYPRFVPCVISISDSGQKHLLYLAPVSFDKSNMTVSLESERISYRPIELLERVELCKRLVSVVGKPPLSEGLTVVQKMLLVERYGGDQWLREWLRVANEPLSRLAVWLCPGKDRCGE